MSKEMEKEDKNNEMQNKVNKIIDEASLIEELKQKHGTIYEGEISLVDENDDQHTVTFIFRKPVMADIEAYQKAVQRNPIIANQNLLQSLIIHPDAKNIVGEIRSYPASYAKFIDDEIAPFFGTLASVRKRKL